MTVAKQKDPQKKALQKRTALAEARKAEVDLERAEISLRLDLLREKEVESAFQWKLNGDREHGVFTLESSVGSSALQLAGDLRQYGRMKPKGPITLDIFSPGGSVMHGLALYDTLRTLSKQGHPVTTVARGYAASMGSLLFLAGDNRLVGSEAQIMFHSLSAGTGGMLYEMEDDIEFYRELNERLFRIITGRSKITAEVLAKRTKKKDWWLGAKEAKKLGVATQIV
ncbi:MAG TPA: ATP-dependent Clp protease proteolytic subunit [Nocardioidaceae bacterium]|nr:ATP-dependent Clp protease proteolytic subunit [Nocardioidaceae bacterium]